MNWEWFVRALEWYTENILLNVCGVIVGAMGIVLLLVILVMPPMCAAILLYDWANPFGYELNRDRNKGGGQGG